MTPIDKYYLLLQFKDKVHQKNATEFQSFFEEIMGKAFKDFQKIRPYGNQGDGGNDGYIPSRGEYYQVYAPKDPGEKEAVAARKFKNNFENLKANWDQISKIKTFNLVFNDKYAGLGIELERARAELKQNDPEIEFKIFQPKDLEEIFFTLKPEQMMESGFNVDSREAFRIAKDYLGKLEEELNKGNPNFVLKVLEDIANIISGQNDQGIALEYEIIEAKALQRIEKVKDSKGKYKGISKRFPSDPRASLFLSEAYLNDEDFPKNKELLEKAEKIDSNYWLLKLEKLIREYRLGNQIDISGINEDEFPVDPKIKADYYRIYSLFLERAGDRTRAESFIEKSIKLNPQKFINQDVRLEFLCQKILSSNDPKIIQSEGDNLINEVEAIREKFLSFSELGPRNNISLNLKKMIIFLKQERESDMVNTAKETLGLIFECYFDYGIDRSLVNLLRFIEISSENFSRLLGYIKKANKLISDDLGRTIVLQFIHKDNLLTEGKKFFEDMKKKDFVQFITDLTKGEYKKALPFIMKDISFAVSFSIVAKPFPGLSKIIFNAIPDDGTVQKDKLMLLLCKIEGDSDGAFSILKGLDISKFSYIECLPALEVAEEKKAWDFVIILLEKLLPLERDRKIALGMKLKLCNANLKLERFPEVIRIGEAILENPDELKFLDADNKEVLLVQIVFAWFKRGGYSDALKIIKKHADFLKTFENKIGVEAETYLQNKLPEKALDVVVEAIKIIKRPSPEQYGSLFFTFTQIGNLMPGFTPVPLKEITLDSFVKLKGEENWYFIGDKDEFDANKVPNEHRKNFLGKKIGEKVSFEHKYISEKKEYEIENILPIEKYICWQSHHQAEKLSLEHLWDKMDVIEVPTTATSVDTKYLEARLKNLTEKSDKFFETYYTQNIPLAVLAVSEGGLTNAIGRITSEKKGFIKFSNGKPEEMEEQKKAAKEAISAQLFYIDGTSALILSETGLIEKIIKFIPNIKVPQSVISLLLESKDKFRYVPGQRGLMGYSQGKLRFSSLDSASRNLIQSNFDKSIKTIESKAQSIEAISSANKLSVFSEEGIPPSLSDACILAQRDKAMVLTEDFLYLQMNEIETKKKIPKYFSAFALMRVLYEQGKISFDEYLNFFAYLSSYRFRFLPISVNDLDKAVFGNGAIKQVRPEELRKFNFPLTLSEEYGVSFEGVFIFIGRFLIKLLIDNSIIPELIEKIFAEIFPTIPVKNKKIFGRTLLAVCVEAINKRARVIALSKRTQEKIDVLSRFVQSGILKDEIIVPKL